MGVLGWLFQEQSTCGTLRRCPSFCHDTYSPGDHSQRRWVATCTCVPQHVCVSLLPRERLMPLARAWSLAPSPAITPQCIIISVTLTRPQGRHAGAPTSCCQGSGGKEGAHRPCLPQAFTYQFPTLAWLGWRRRRVGALAPLPTRSPNKLQTCPDSWVVKILPGPLFRLD